MDVKEDNCSITDVSDDDILSAFSARSCGRLIKQEVNGLDAWCAICGHTNFALIGMKSSFVLSSINKCCNHIF